MKIAAFNVENLFERAKAFNKPTVADAQDTLRATAELNALFERESYGGVENQIVAFVKQLGLDKSDRGNDAVLLRRIRGSVLKRSGGTVTVTAKGRADWIGWVEAKTAPVNEIAIDNTGRVIRDVDADILAVIEADNRVALNRFSKDVLNRIKPSGVPYEHVLLIDGNDERGIDVGLMTRKQFAVRHIRTHIYDLNDKDKPIFSRDCPEYGVENTATGEMIWVLPNHFKSKFGGDSPSSQARREAQAKRTAEIYDDLRASGEDLVVVLGDFNDIPDSAPLQPLLANTDLQDVSAHESFDPGEFSGKGTFGLGNDSQKIDYLLLSPALFARVETSGLFRMGAWPGVSPKRWTVYKELQHKVQIASDHHVIWAEIA
jgi:endonuclease/exonuclease/phosphatase family metal-dependent hydrolase